jgi:hypothetical protein
VAIPRAQAADALNKAAQDAEKCSKATGAAARHASLARRLLVRLPCSLLVEARPCSLLVRLPCSLLNEARRQAASRIKPVKCVRSCQRA